MIGKKIIKNGIKYREWFSRRRELLIFVHLTHWVSWLGYDKRNLKENNLKFSYYYDAMQATFYCLLPGAFVLYSEQMITCN